MNVIPVKPHPHPISRGTKPAGYHFDRAALETAFNQICDPIDWKNPINRVISTRAVPLAREAIRYFTATDTIEMDAGEPGKTRIVSIGYRHGPAGP
jgi:hypothetical protein